MNILGCLDTPTSGTYILNNQDVSKLKDNELAEIRNKEIGFVFQTYETIVGTKTFGVSFQLYGVDVAINQDLKPMVMEINKGPDLGGKDGRDRELKIGLGTDILKSVGLIPNIDNKFITVLETVNINGNVVPIHNLIDC
jgi:ABC-type dipeptide/oligopeptide/nickel transport system ATPase component